MIGGVGTLFVSTLLVNTLFFVLIQCLPAAFIFLENPQVQLPDKIIKSLAYYSILGLWKLNEVPLEMYLMRKMYLMNMIKKLKGSKFIPL